MKTFGHFSDDGREYIITDPLAPPRGQVNFMWNDHIVSCCDQFGSGLSVFNDRTMMHNDPLGRVQIIDNGRRHFYIRDNDSGEYWNTGLLPTKPDGSKYDAAMLLEPRAEPQIKTISRRSEAPLSVAHLLEQ